MMCSGGNRSDEGGYYQIYYGCYFSIIIFLFFPFKVTSVHVIIYSDYRSKGGTVC